MISSKEKKKVSKLKEFFKNRLTLIQEKYVFEELTTLIEESQEDV